MPRQQPPKANSSVISKKEQKRLSGLVVFEEEVRGQGYQLIAGVDEAGRGPLAGPVAAAACMIPQGIFFRGIDDSKKLSPLQRERLFKQITQSEGVVYSVSLVSHEEIDRINIYQATIKAMLQAITMLAVCPDYLLVDGMQLNHPAIPSKKIVQGDAKSQSIAAASIVAKVTRDRLMEEFHERWPQYGFKNHKGYGTEQHLAALAELGPCPIHRRTFQGVQIVESLRTSF